MKRAFVSIIILLCVYYGVRCPSAQAEDDNLPSAPTPMAKAVEGSSPTTPSVPRSYHPAFPVTRATWGMKLEYYLRSTTSFRNFLEGGLVAGIPDLPSAPKQPQPPTTITIDSVQHYANAMDAYGNGMDYWRHSSEEELRYRGGRFGVGITTAETRQLLSNLVIPVALRQDPRYIPAPIDESFGQRMWHAVSSIAVTRSDSGYLVPNYSKLGGTVAAGFLGKTYAKEFDIRELHTSQYVRRYIGYSLAGDLATNVGRELVRTAIRPDLEMYSAEGASTQDSYYPLSTGGKTFYWLRSTWGSRNFIQGVLIAGYPNIPSQPDEPAVPNIQTQEQALAFDAIFVQYGKDIQAWRDNMENDVRYHERRLIGGVGESETQQFIANFLLPVGLGMDPRYIPLGSGHPAGSRFASALSGIVMGHTDSGRKMINIPVLAGTVGAAFIARDFYYPKLGLPELETNQVMAKTIGLNLAADGIYNLFGEFFTHRGF